MRYHPDKWPRYHRAFFWLMELEKYPKLKVHLCIHWRYIYIYIYINPISRSHFHWLLFLPICFSFLFYFQAFCFDFSLPLILWRPTCLSFTTFPFCLYLLQILDTVGWKQPTSFVRLWAEWSSWRVLSRVSTDSSLVGAVFPAIQPDESAP